MKILLLAMLALAVPLQTGHSVPQGANDGWVFVSGNKLLEECRTNDEAFKLGCVRYITGVMDLIGTEQGSTLSPDHRDAWQYHFVCLPEHATASQIRDLVVRDLETFPETRDRPAASLIIVSVLKAWPCPSK
jgi:hypothetical protein